MAKTLAIVSAPGYAAGMSERLAVLEVDRSDYRRTRTLESEVPRPSSEEVLLRVDRFALTANNITYAAAGDLLDYWGFFPSGAPWGRIPVMGLASIVASANPELPEGGTYFGFYPMATHLLVAAEARGDGFVDAGPHRARHASVYRSFTPATADPAFQVGTRDRYLLLRGLVLTSFLVDDFLGEAEFFGATAVVVTSASSKTSIALAHRLARRPGATVVGVTSAANRSFVEGVGHYDQVVTYDDLDALDVSAATVIVDMAGDTDLLADLHRRLGDRLAYSCRVGGTHWEAMGGGEEFVGPSPEFFFAPSQVAKRRADWGVERFGEITATALAELIADSQRWLTVSHHAGPAAVEAVYRHLVDNRHPPADGAVASMWDGTFADGRS